MEMKLFLYLLIAAGYFYTFYKLFPLAGRKAWEGLVPGYNLWIWIKVIQKPWWYSILLIFPGVNVLVIMIMSASLSSVFGRRSASDYLQAALIPFIYFPRLANTKNLSYLGPIDRTKVKKNGTQEWRDAILFAIIAASLIRTYVMEAYTIPTASMEKTMLIGDYLFVSKMAYGAKIPMTPLSFPFAHHTLPFSENVASYLKWMDLPYMRLPGYSDVERNDVVVFNYPEGDTVCVELQSNKSFHQMRREFSYFFGKDKAEIYMRTGIPTAEQRTRATQLLASTLGSLGLPRDKISKVINEGFDFTVRPIDKRENYIKRCVGISGDTLQVDKGVLYINGEVASIPAEFQYNYYLYTEEFLNKKKLKNDFGVSYSDQRKLDGEPGYIMPMTFDNYQKIKELPQILTSAPTLNKGGFDPSMRIYPNHPNFNYTEDFFGPIVIPAAGMSIPLNEKTIPIYSRAIRIYEGNTLSQKDGKILINGEEQREYTFKLNYYWMMGDNRHNSADSRFWGFVPEDHIVGEASFIWLSLDQEVGWFDGKIRWNRFFQSVN